jgi:hypothetical protein
MLVSTFVPACILKATGEVFSGTSGDSDWTRVLAVANRYIDSWMSEPGVDWDSTYQTTDIGTVSATDSYDLDDDIYRVSNDAGDPIRINHTDGTHTDYDLVPASHLRRYTTQKVCSRVGRTIKFPRAFVSTDPQFGGTIEVPGYVKPDYLVNDNDEILVDDPNWLILMTAAELSRTDLTQAQNYPLLVTEANNAMRSMKRANTPQVHEIQKSPVGGGSDW